MVPLNRTCASGAPPENECMKILRISCLLVVLIAAPPAFGGIKVPPNAYRKGQYAAASKESLEKKKPLLIVISRENLNQKEGGNTNENTEMVFTAFAKTSVVLFLESDNKPPAELPPPLLTWMVSIAGHEVLPRMVVAAPGATEVWYHQDATDLADLSKARRVYKEGADQVAVKLAAWIKAPPATAAPTPPGEAKLVWLRAGEGAVVGKFVKVADGKLHLIQENGSPGKIGLDELAPASAEYARQLEAATSAPAVAPVQPLGPEKWTNQQGKAIEATFVALKDDRLTLRLATGKESTVALSSLAEASRKRAQELAAQAKP